MNINFQASRQINSRHPMRRELVNRQIAQNPQKLCAGDNVLAPIVVGMRRVLREGVIHVKILNSCWVLIDGDKQLQRFNEGELIKC